MHDNIKICSWNPWDILDCPEQAGPYAVLVLNRPIILPFGPKTLLRIWNKALVRVTVDGGTDQWLKWLNKNNVEDSANIDLVTGDFDSIQPKTLEHFMNQINTKVVYTEDQNETDYTKSLKELGKYLKDHRIQIHSLVVLIDTSGRFDQTMANINTLFKAKKILPDVQIYNLANDSFTWLLERGNHNITIPSPLLCQNSWCSLIPFGKSPVVSTTGLKWNLDETIMKFGEMVSTSNTYSGENHVEIKTDDAIVWSMCIENLCN